MLSNVSYDIIRNNIIYGLGVGILTVSEILSLLGNERGGACPGTYQGTTWYVLLNVNYHKEFHYIWLRGGDLNGF